MITCGYPAGGEQISYTRGVVSRIEMQNYVHIGNKAFLSVQTDAAINPGNSGGPVFQDDKVVGVAFMGIPGLEATGFFIPPSVIDHFLKDIEDDKYEGFPKAGVRIVSLQNPAYRKFLGLPPTGDGARIDSLAAYTEKDGLLKKDAPRARQLPNRCSFWAGCSKQVLMVPPPLQRRHPLSSTLRTGSNGLCYCPDPLRQHL